ncbi:outer membrane beta-barrel protein [Persicobacter diffluens]|uniref:Outer membrane protein beta-barrel domain-containing protein n=1 Tax=Persicobacter diffluens TaxID=981 RepID=A0AAN4W553_9BACT|nr:hypothetical protein PEDI_55810 [Persicobacter diffluens]
MKRFFLMTVLAIVCQTSFAQGFELEKLRAGLGLVYASEIKSVGINLNGAYAITEEWEAAVGFTHIFENNAVRYNVLDFDGHYNFYTDGDKLKIYGLAGLGLTFWKVTIPAIDMGFGFSSPETTSTGTEVGLNLGIGANYALSDKLNLAPEIRFTAMDGSYLRIGAAIQYRF